jgi:hypothetical protein
MADEPVSRILRAILKTRNLLIPFHADLSMKSASAKTEGFLSHFLSHFLSDENEFRFEIRFELTTSGYEHVQIYTAR